MVNTRARSAAAHLHGPTVLIGTYAALSVATLVLLAVLAAAAPALATADAWVHAALVALFAVLLCLRLRSARRGSAGALRAVVVICGVLLVANVVEAALPGAFPGWMRAEMVLLALVVGAAGVLALRAART